MNYLTLIRLFGGPLGQLANKAIFAGGGALTAWAASKGMDQNMVAGIVGPLMIAASTIVDMMLGTQTAKIQSVNADDSNGVKVVRADAAGTPVNRPLAP